MAVALAKQTFGNDFVFMVRLDIFSHQVRIVPFGEKGVSVESEQVEAGNLPHDLIDLNPYQKVCRLWSIVN